MYPFSTPQLQNVIYLQFYHSWNSMKPTIAMCTHSLCFYTISHIYTHLSELENHIYCVLVIGFHSNQNHWNFYFTMGKRATD